MPKNTIGSAPFPVRALDRDNPITHPDLGTLLRETGQQLSLCLRTEYGHPNRGGYFFHIDGTTSPPNFDIFDFSGNHVTNLTGDHLVRFINHVGGRQFDEEMLELCQQVINFRSD